MIHITGGRLVSMESTKARDKGSGGDIDISNDVERQAIEGDYEGEEDKVCCQFEKI